MKLPTTLDRRLLPTPARRPSAQIAKRGAAGLANSARPPDRSDLPVAVIRMPLLIEAQRRAASRQVQRFWSSYDAMGEPAV